MVKLWQASRIIGCSPFDLLGHTIPEIDFILEMYALEDSKNGTFTRPGKPKPLPQAEIQAAWSQVLVGAANDERMGRFMPSKETLAAASKLMNQFSPRIVRGPAGKT